MQKPAAGKEAEGFDTSDKESTTKDDEQGQSEYSGTTVSKRHTKEKY